MARHGHVRRQRLLPVRNAASWMRGHTHVLVEDLQHVAGEPDVHSLVCQGVRDGVVMPVDFDVVVEVDPDLLPCGQSVVGRRGL